MAASRAQGFMLLEVLIAFVITILALSLIIGAASDALSGTGLSARYQEATIRAQSRMSAAADAGKPRLGERQGDDGGGFQWHERVLALRTNAAHAPDQAEPPFTLYGITVWISWKDGIATKSVRLDTQRVAAAP